MMFWKSSSKEKDKKPSPRTVKSHGFHDDPSKSWGYYNSTAKLELQGLVTVKKTETATTSESTAWTRQFDVLSYDGDGEGEPMIVDDQQELEEEVLLTPEGITRVPFTSWEVDLLGTARLSSYYQRRVYSAFKGARTTYQSMAFRQAAQNSSTPHNSPRPHMSPI